MSGFLHLTVMFLRFINVLEIKFLRLLALKGRREGGEEIDLW